MTTALEGVRVLDLTQLAPGPYCSMLLADFGADVVVVERVTTESGPHFALGRNKRSLRVDLKKPEGTELFRSLAQQADVVLEGFRPGVVERLGIDARTLCAENPRLVYCSLSGYGQTGPYAERAGHDIDYIAIGGALGMIGRPGSKPAIPANLIADYAGGGLFAALGILMALYSRERTGRGQVVDVAMTDGVLSLLTKLAGQYFDLGSVPAPSAHRINGAAPEYDVYECADGRWVAVGALEPHFFDELCRQLGVSVDRDDPAAARAAFEARFRERSRDDWTELLATTDACVAPVLSLDEALADPHHRAREMVARLAGRDTVGVAPKLDRTPGTLRRPPPRPGEHTDEILSELGLDPARIAELRASKVVA